MKIHIAGFNIDDRKPDTFSAPYHGMICKNGIQYWETPDDVESDELALIVSRGTICTASRGGGHECH